MTEPVSISIKAGDLSGLDAIVRRLTELRRQMGASPATGGQGGLNVAVNMRPGDLSGLQRLTQQVQGSLASLGFEALPGGGVRRVGYQGGMPLGSGHL